MWDLGADNRSDAEFESPWHMVAHLLLINLILKVMQSSFSCKRKKVGHFESGFSCGAERQQSVSLKYEPGEMVHFLLLTLQKEGN